MHRVLQVVLLGSLVPIAAATAAEGEVNLFAGDVGNAVWTLIIFLAVIFVLGKFAWGPLLNGLQQRERFIRNSLTSAKRDREEAERRLLEIEERLAAARSEATKIIDTGRRNGEKLRDRIESDARSEAEKTVERALREIELAKQGAIRDLYATSASLATDIAAKIVGRELETKDHERLIQESIDELSALDRN